MKIIELSKKEYKGYKLEYRYQTKFFYDVKIKEKHDVKITLKKKKTLFKQEKTFKDELFADYIDVSDVFGIFEKKKLIAVVEGSLETWNSRYRIWNVLVEQKYRRKGYGKMLFDHIEMVAKKKGARALILETQSCNYPAIQFYKKMGYHFKGLDLASYSNDDIKKKEVRLEYGKEIK